MARLKEPKEIMLVFGNVYVTTVATNIWVQLADSRGDLLVSHRDIKVSGGIYEIGGSWNKLRKRSRSCQRQKKYI
jgi:hypothetical protein